MPIVYLEVSPIPNDDMQSGEALCSGLSPWGTEGGVTVAAFDLPSSQESGFQAGSLSYGRWVGGQISDWIKPEEMNFLEQRNLAHATLDLLSSRIFSSEIDTMHEAMMPGILNGGHRLIVTRNCAMIHADCMALIDLKNSGRLNGAIRVGRIAKVVMPAGGSSHRRLIAQKEINFFADLLSDTLVSALGHGHHEVCVSRASGKP